MPLLRNKHQPYFPDPDAPAVLNCNGAYCWPFQLGDPFDQQWYQTPCSNNLVEDPEFDSPTLGSNLITNGTFATDLSGWTTGNWTWVAGTAQAPAPPTANFLTQTIGPGIAYRMYRITFDVSGLNTGDILRVHLGSSTGWYEYTANGSVDDFIMFRPNDLDLSFVQPTTNTGQIVIDNVTLQLVTYGSWTTNNAWSLSTDGFACKGAAGTGNLVNGTSDYMDSGDYYYVRATFSSISSGSIQVYIDDGAGVETNLQTAVTSNGTYEYWITASQNGQIAFKPSSDFIGCVSDPQVFRLRNDYSGDIVAPDGTRYDISPYFSYHKDKVTLNSNIFDLLELSYQCYSVEIFDACLIQGNDLVTDGNFSNGDYTNWQRNNGSNQYDITGGDLTFIFEPLEGATLITNGDFSAGATGWTLGAGWSIVGNAAVHTPGSTATLSQTVTIATPATPPDVLVHWWQLIISGWSAGTITVTLGDVTSLTFGANDTITAPLTPGVGGSVTFAITPSSNFNGTIDNIALHAATQIWSANPIIYNSVNTAYVAGNYQIQWELLSTTGSALIAGAMGIQGQSQSLVYYTAAGTHTDQVLNYVPGGQRAYLTARFRVGNIYYPGRLTVDNVEAIRVEPFEATYISECIDYREEFDNTFLVSSYSDQDAMGFTFDDADFKIQFRIESRGLNPVYSRGGYASVFGTGDYRIGYTELSKLYQLVFGYVSEAAHDAIAAAISLDHFLVGVSESDQTEFVVEVEDYNPQWRAQGDYSLAPSVINMRLKTGGQVYNRHT